MEQSRGRARLVMLLSGGLAIGVASLLSYVVGFGAGAVGSERALDPTSSATDGGVGIEQRSSLAPTTPIAADSSSDAVDTAGNTAIVTARVVSSRTGEPLLYARMALLVGSEVVYTADSDDGGVVRLDAVPPGAYSTRFSSIGCAPSADEELSVSSSDVVDLGVVALRPHRLISGRVRAPDGGTLREVVVTLRDTFRFNFTGAADYIKLLRAARDGMPVRATLVLDQQGRFEAYGDQLHPGDYLLRVDADKYGTAFAPVHLTTEAPLEHDVVLGQSGTIEGVVLDAAGAGVQGCKVAALRSPGMPTGDADGTVMRRHVTRADLSGRFTFEGLSSGAYQLLVVDDRFSGMSTTVRAPTTGVVMRVAPALVVRGVVLDGISRAPVSGADVVGVGEQGVLSGVSAAVSGRQGEFQLGGLPGGGVRITFTAPGYDSLAIRVEGQGGEEVSRDVQLQSSSQPLRGRALNEVDGTPVVACRVLIITESETGFEWNGSISAPTGADGGFELVLNERDTQEARSGATKRSGRQFLVAWSRTHAQLRPTILEPRVLDSNGGGEVVLSMVRFARVEGVVVDLSGAQVSGARIEIHRRNTPLQEFAERIRKRLDAVPTICSDSAGRFVIPSVVPGAEVRVVASLANGGIAQSEQFSLAAGETRAELPVMPRR